MLRRKGFNLFTMEPVWFYEADDGKGTGGSGGSEEHDPDRPGRQDPEVVKARFSGDATRMAAQIDELEREAYNHRSRNRKLKDSHDVLKQENDQLKDKLPKDGQVVLSQKDADELEAYRQVGTLDEISGPLPDDQVVLSKSEQEELESYRALGTTDEIIGLKAELPKLQETNQQLQRTQMLSDVADNVAPGYRLKLPVFRDLDSRVPGLAYEHRKVKNEDTGEEEDRVFVKWEEGTGKDAKAKESDLLAFVKDNPVWRDYEAALLVTNGANHQAGGVQFPEQRQGQAKDEPLAAVSFVQQRYGHNAKSVAAK